MDDKDRPTVSVSVLHAMGAYDESVWRELWLVLQQKFTKLHHKDGVVLLQENAPPVIRVAVHQKAYTVEMWRFGWIDERGEHEARVGYLDEHNLVYVSKVNR